MNLDENVIMLQFRDRYFAHTPGFCFFVLINNERFHDRATLFWGRWARTGMNTSSASVEPTVIVAAKASVGGSGKTLAAVEPIAAQAIWRNP